MSLQVAWDDFPNITHYHIRWSGTETLDWERFTTRHAAEIAAGNLMRPGEQYTIEQEGKDCSRCARFVALRAKSQTK